MNPTVALGMGFLALGFIGCGACIAIDFLRWRAVVRLRKAYEAEQARRIQRSIVPRDERCPLCGRPPQSQKVEFT